MFKMVGTVNMLVTRQCAVSRHASSRATLSPDGNGECAATEHCRSAAGAGEISDLLSGQTEICRHPNGAEPKAGEHRFEKLIRILRLHQDAVRLAHAARGKCGGCGIDAGIHLCPSP